LSYPVQLLSSGTWCTQTKSAGFQPLEGRPPVGASNAALVKAVAATLKTHDGYTGRKPALAVFR